MILKTCEPFNIICLLPHFVKDVAIYNHRNKVKHTNEDGYVVHLLVIMSSPLILALPVRVKVISLEVM